MNEIHADGAAALGDDGNRPDGLDVVEAGRGNEVGLNTLDELMRNLRVSPFGEGRSARVSRASFPIDEKVNGDV